MKIDFHIHTHHSYDSMMKPEKILRVARSRGLDGIVVCDHNTVKGGLETQSLNTADNFVVIVGAEIATDAGDVTGIFLTREIEARDFNQVVTEIKKQGGKVILNHPYKGHDLTRIDFGQIDFIEGYNSRLDPDHNRRAVELAEKHNIPILAGSDAHCYAEIANCYSEVENIHDFRAVNHKYAPSSQLHVTLSQYVKAFKKKKPGIFVSATVVHLKRSLKRTFGKK